MEKAAQPLPTPPRRGMRWAAIKTNSHTMAASAMTAANTKCCETKVVLDGAVNVTSSSIALRSPSPERSLMMEHIPSPQWPCRSIAAGLHSFNYWTNYWIDPHSETLIVHYWLEAWTIVEPIVEKL